MARIVGAKGLRGAVKIEMLTDDPGRFSVGSELQIEGEARPRQVTAVERAPRPRAIGLAGIESRNAAEGLIGRYLEADAPDLPEGSWYWHQLEGLTVIDEAGLVIGRLVEVFRAGGAEVYRVERDGAEDLLVPALRRLVLSVDPAAGRMVLSADALEAPE
ncbi:MAG: ribosome maturation factor RimM [Chloroflexota bacterium]